jgi:hypothetical protein
MKRSRVVPVMVSLLLVAVVASACAQVAPRVIRPPTEIRPPTVTQITPLATGPGLYEILPPRFGVEDAARLLPGMQIIARYQPPATAVAALPGREIALFGRAPDAPSALYDSAQGSLLWLPDLAEAAPAPTQDEAKRIALEYVSRRRLTPAREAGAWEVEDVTTLTRRDSSPEAKPEDVLQTVRFVRMLDGLRVRGEHSILTVQVGADGKVSGLIRDFRPLRRARQVFPMKSRDQMDREMQRKFDALLADLKQKNPDYEAELTKTELIYYEQGGRYLQPALFGSVLIRGPEGMVGGKSLLVQALAQTLEPIQERTRPAPEMPRSTKPRPGTLGALPAPTYRMELTGLTLEAAPLLLQAIPADIRYGMYVVRDDSWDWVDDAWDFHTHLSSANSVYRAILNPTAKQTVMDQYFWNHVWLFLAGEGESDHSPYFVRKVDFVIIEGHGAPYLITTRSNCCDVIELEDIPGYGPHSSLGGRTDYVLWKSCHVIPAPPEDEDWPDVWWSLFKGMRGNYGFCTSMWIDDDISDNFGTSLGVNLPVLSSWFSAVDSCKWNHDSGLEYGSAVMPCGQENQRIYDFLGVPNPDCLVIWWQHP